MAATAAAPSVIDLKSSGTLPIRLGASILDNSPSDTSRFLSVRYNHRPQLQQTDPTRATVTDNGEHGLSKLSLECEEGKYDYTGRHGQEDDMYVLLSRGQGKDKELVLERLSSSHAFNLTSTPSEHDATTLATRHAHIPIDVGEEDDLFGDDEDEPAEDSNPFDYRHFLKAELEKPENTNPSLDATRSAAGTPLVQQQRSGDTPVRKPVKPAAKVQPPKKRKPAATTKPNPKRVKAGEEPPPETAKSKAKADIPKVRLDRKASLRRSSIIDDSGELILENETPAKEKVSKPNAMSLALSGQLNEGPISLMSAASTPGEGPSTNTHEPEEVMETYEFELGDSSPEREQEEEDNGDLVLEEEEEQPVHAAPEEEDHDEDVDPMELPSPAQGRSRPSVTAAAGLAGGDEDEDDDLDKQLALAMAEDGDGSEESEEE